MEPIEIDGQFYVIGKMGALTQFHVVRRLAPILSSMGVKASNIGDKSLQVADFLGPIADVVATMREEDVNYIMFNCLDVVKRIENDRAAKVRSSSGQMMFQDIDMSTMLRLVVEVLRENLGGFFKAPPAVTTSP